MTNIGQDFNFQGKKLTKQEFANLENVKNNEKLQMIFDTYDTNKDNELDENELTKAFGDFFEYDKNNDQTLSKTESKELKQKIVKPEDADSVDDTQFNDFFATLAEKYQTNDINSQYHFDNDGNAFLNYDSERKNGAGFEKAIWRDGSETEYYTKGKKAGLPKSGENAAGVSYKYKYNKDGSHTVKFEDGSKATFDKNYNELKRTFANGGNYKVETNEQGKQTRVWEDTQIGIPYDIHDLHDKEKETVYNIGYGVVNLQGDKATHYLDLPSDPSLVLHTKNPLYKPETDEKTNVESDAPKTKQKESKKTTHKPENAEVQQNSTPPQKTGSVDVEPENRKEKKIKHQETASTTVEPEAPKTKVKKSSSNPVKVEEPENKKVKEQDRKPKAEKPEEINEIKWEDGSKTEYYTKGKKAGLPKSGENAAGVSYKYKYHKDGSYTVKFEDGSKATFDKNHNELKRTFYNGGSYRIETDKQGNQTRIWEDTQIGIPYDIHDLHDKEKETVYDIGYGAVNLKGDKATHYLDLPSDPSLVLHTKNPLYKPETKEQ